MAVVSFKRILSGIKYGIIAEGIFLIIQIFMILFVFDTDFGFTSFEYSFFIFGGIYLTISGCIGPGGYKKEYKILLFTPTHGSSYSEKIEIMAFVTDNSINNAEVIINEDNIDLIDFDSEGRGVIMIDRSDFENLIINKIYLRSDDYISNNSEFTLFEYREDMTEDEIEELYQMELSQKQEKTLEEAQKSYLKKANNRLGSVALGLFILAIINFGLSVLFSFLSFN